MWDTVAEAILRPRARRPAFLHLRTVRLWGHAGSDAEQSYRSTAEIAENDRAIRTRATLAA